MRTACRPLLTVLLALAATAALCPAQAAQVREVRVSATAHATRAVFDLSGAVDYKLFQLSSPDRIVLDFEDSRAAERLGSASGDGLIRDFRTGRHGKHGLRVVMDLKGKATPSSFLLKPNTSHGYRLVVDLNGDSGTAKATPHIAAAPVSMPLTGDRKVVVAIDAGHGGIDPGAHGPHGTLEKNVTLAVAKQLARMVDAQPGMKAVLTRTGDYFIPLKRRYEIARQHNADLFISIHADAFRNHDAEGSSVWVLSPRGKTSEAARWLADRENRSDLIGGVSLDDKDDTLAAVLLDLQQGYAIQASEKVGKDVLKALAKIGPTHRGYVERANFVVLRSPDVPSILVETAFITNPGEERKLRSPAHRKLLAKAILHGVEGYFENTPPPGTWFATRWAREHGVQVAMADKHASASGSPKAADAGVQDLHKVASGETLSGIAQQYGVSIEAIKDANHMRSNMLRAGSMLTIPAS